MEPAGSSRFQTLKPLSFPCCLNRACSLQLVACSFSLYLPSNLVFAQRNYYSHPILFRSTPVHPDAPVVEMDPDTGYHLYHTIRIRILFLPAFFQQCRELAEQTDRY